MQGLIGKKIGMTRIFEAETGKSIPVTVIHAGTNVVHQIKTVEKDGYQAVQLGFESIAEKKLTKPQSGHFKKLGSEATRYLKEFGIDDSDSNLKPGDKIGVEIFESIKEIKVVGISKGRGFAGTIKRYSFHRGRETHGNKNVRERGSMGAGTYPGRVFPGLKMAGHYGNRQVTVRNVTVAGVDKEEGLVFIKGAVPGKQSGIVYLVKQ